MNLLVIFIASPSKSCLCLPYTNRNLSFFYLFVFDLIACSFGKESKWLVLYYIMSTHGCAWLFAMNTVQWVNWYPKRGHQGKLFYCSMLACHFLKQMLNGSLFTTVNTKSFQSNSFYKIGVNVSGTPSHQRNEVQVPDSYKASITVLHSPAIALHPLLPSSCANREWQALLISMPGRSRHSTNMWWINYWQVLHTPACLTVSIEMEN